MKKKFLSMFAIVGLAVATTLSISPLTACYDDDDDPTEEVGTDDSDADADDNSSDGDSDDSSSSDDSDSSTSAGDAIDLGLSVKWASVNVGATKPADYGNYYAWGEIATKSSYDEGNSLTFGDLSFGDISGNGKYDAARANWGGSWRMPTKAECEELVNKCEWTWTTQENSDGEEINGCKVTGPNGNSIFLPASGFCNGSLHYLGSTLYRAGKDGNYWSSTPDESYGNIAYHLTFGRSSLRVSLTNRYYGLSVRPVSE